MNEIEEFKHELENVTTVKQLWQIKARIREANLTDEEREELREVCDRREGQVTILSHTDDFMNEYAHGNATGSNWFNKMESDPEYVIFRSAWRLLAGRACSGRRFDDQDEIVTEIRNQYTSAEMPMIKRIVTDACTGFARQLKSLEPEIRGMADDAFRVYVEEKEDNEE